MDRFLKQTAPQLRVTFLSAATGLPVDATGTPTVTITREDGTALVTGANTTKVTGETGIYSYTLTPAQTADLDVLTAAWSGEVEGTSQTYTTEAEIVGAHLCSIAQIDAELNRGGTASTYDIDDKHAARNAATEAFESETRQAFSPRYGRVSLDGTSGDLLLPHRPLSVTSGTVDGTALTSTELADLEVYDSGLLYNPANWATGRRNVVLKITYGHRYPPADVSRAVAILAAHLLKDGPFDDRGYGVTEEGGAVRLLTAGVQGARFSIPEVEATAQRYRPPVVA